MSPELVNAIKERIGRGYAKDAIKSEVLRMGHSEELFEAAYTLAVHDASLGSQVTTTVSETHQKLSPITALVHEAIIFAAKRWEMVALLAFPLVFFVLSTELSLRFEGDLLIMGLISGVSIVVFFLYIINMMVALYLVSRGSELERATYAEGFLWTKKNFFSFIFVYTLTIFAVVGGFVLFIVPGFILLISLYFSQYVFVLEGKRGMSALLRSRAIVKGRRLTVLFKVIGLALYFFIPVFLVAFVFEIVKSLYPLPDLRVLGEVLMQIAAAFFTVISMRVMFQMYRELAVGVSEDAPSKTVTATHWVLVSIGLVIIPVIIVATLFFSSISEFGDMAPLPTQNSEPVAGMSLLDLQADRFFEDNSSYRGVCESLKTAISSGEEIECNEGDTEWAISASNAEQRWCVDSSNPNPKRVRSALGDKTTCFSI